MRTAALLAAALAVACTGCASQDERTDSVAASSPVPASARLDDRSDPGRALEAFAAAAHERNAEAMWALLSRPSRMRLGPSLEEFRHAAATRLQRTVGRVGGPSSQLVLAVRITTRWAVAAAERARLPYAVYAAALRREGGAWKLELADPLRVRALRPEPAERLARAHGMVAAEFKAQGAIAEAGVWLDGQAIPTRGGGPTPAYLTAYGDSGPLEPGRHSVVAFASTNRHAAALAWMFHIRMAGGA